MAFEDFKKKLEDTDSSEHIALLKHVKGLIDKSRKDMSVNYDKWDENDRIFRSKRKVDREDRTSESKGQPKKMVVPLTFSQIMTFVAFSIMSITQNRRFFELEPTGTEDNPLEEPMELIIERDLRRNQWNTFLVEFFLDIGRFSLGVGEVCYAEESRWMRIPKTETVQTGGPFGVEDQKTTYNFEQIPSFLGNRIQSISPYRFYPDTNYPLTRYQEGEFCGSEDVFAYSSLKSQPGTFNLDKINKFSEEDYGTRKKNSRIDFGPAQRENPNLGKTDATTSEDNKVKSGPVCVTKVVFDQIPKDLEVGEGGVSLGDEDFPVRYLCHYANDGTIIRFEEAYYLHCMFPYFLGQYLPDKHSATFEGLADVCEELTNLVTWKINAHVRSQKNSVESKYIVDPAGIDVNKIDHKSPYIFLRKNASLTGVDRYIKQFKTEDVTASVFSDVAAIDGLLEKVTGWSGQMQGQYSQGRRSATQDRVVAQGASARGKTVLGSIWDTGFEKLGKQLIANNRQDMDFETFMRIMGKRTWPVNFDVPPTPGPMSVDPATGQPVQGAPIPVRFTDEEVFAMFKSDPKGIAMSEDFFVFDGTLPSEKAFLAQSLQEIVMQIMQNPLIAQIMGYGPDQLQALFNQVYILRGVTPARLPKSTTPAPVPAAPVQPNVVPMPQTQPAASG